MTDLLTPLYDLQGPGLDVKDTRGLAVRRVLAPEKDRVVSWVRAEFGDGWASEVDVAASQSPATVWIAVQENNIVGFACFDAVAKGFFGPTGVLESERGKGTGAKLLFAVLEGMRSTGYGYAVIGGAGARGFYERHLKIFEIPDSTPGIYKGMLKSSD